MVETRNVGRSGLRVSALGLGTNNFGPRLDLEGAREVVEAALDEGITFFDTANTYGNGAAEEYLGTILGSRRKDVIVATKLAMGVPGAPDTSRRNIIAGVEAALVRLKTDWIDLLQLHRFDPRTPPEETLSALEDLIRSGKVRYVGCSNYSVWRYVEAVMVAANRSFAGFASGMEEYSLIRREIENELLPPMQHYGTGLLAYAPLARGMLLGKYTRGAPLPPAARLSSQPKFAARYLTPQNFDTMDRLQALSEETGIELIDLSLGWMAQRSTVSSVVVGAMTTGQMRRNVEAFSRRLPDEIIQKIDDLTMPGNKPAEKGD